jgi:hypothetical protein
MSAFRSAGIFSSKGSAHFGPGQSLDLRLIGAMHPEATISIEVWGAATVTYLGCGEVNFRVMRFRLATAPILAPVTGLRDLFRTYASLSPVSSKEPALANSFRNSVWYAPCSGDYLGPKSWNPFYMKQCPYSRSRNQLQFPLYMFYNFA